MSEINVITNLEQLRARVGEPHPLVSNKLLKSMDAMAHRFISRAPFAMLATADKNGHPDVSPRGDGPGFAIIADDNTLYLPERPGNKLAFSLQNILVNPNVALIFIIPGVSETYRVHGTARIVDNEDILDRFIADKRKPLCAIEINVSLCFLHCGKAMIRSDLWSAEAQESEMSFKFGAVTARESGGGKDVEDMVDKIVAEDYRDNL